MSYAEERFALRAAAGRLLNRVRLAFDVAGEDQEVSQDNPLPVAIVSGGGGGVGGLTDAQLRAAAVPVSVPTVANTTRAYDWANGQRLTTADAGAVRSTAIAAAEVLLHASGRGFVRVGDNTVVAAVAAGSIPLEAGEKFHLRLTSGQFISWVRDGATDASLSIMPVAA